MSDTPRVDELIHGPAAIGRAPKLNDALGLAMQLEREVATLRVALSEMATEAHCIAKAGPIATPDLQVAWEKFMRLGVHATAALAATTHSDLRCK
jgi:hypothetical protein